LANAAIRIPKKEALELSHYPWFERQNVPVVLEGLTDDWPAMTTCRWNTLVENYGEYYWRFSDTHGAGMALNTYQKYTSTLEGITDDAPLAVYDSQLAGDDRAVLLEDYRVPECFASPDLFEELGEEERPPYRWILMGPARSGTGLHIDPMGTHAWVTVVEGLKRWVLFPYGTDMEKIKMQGTQIPSALWFDKWYDSAVRAVPGTIEVLQRPGETVYVPAGWPHLVLNLERTVAITHNYATEYPSMDRIVRAVEEEEPELAMKWMQLLRRLRPELVTLNTKQQDRTEAQFVAVDSLEVSDARIR
jgi:histone arginine demethylase JMJD6